MHTHLMTCNRARTQYIVYRCKTRAPKGAGFAGGFLAELESPVMSGPLIPLYHLLPLSKLISVKVRIPGLLSVLGQSQRSWVLKDQSPKG